MPLSLDEVHDRINSWVIADHQSRRGDADRALATLDQAAADPGADPYLIEAMRADVLEEHGRLHEAMRWFTIGLRDLDPQQDLPEPEEEYALIGRWRVRRAFELPPDHYDDLARTTLELRRLR